jgi:2-keto-4-pentenoate hydratase
MRIDSMSDPVTIVPGALQRLSDELLAARKTRTPIAPPTETQPSLRIADAYAIAQRGVATEVSAGARCVGHKIGLTAVTVQRQLGVDSPDYGILLDTMQIEAAALIDSAMFIAPRIEPELAFRLHAGLPSHGVAEADVRAATETIHPAFELVDSRIIDWRISLTDTVADRASAAGFIIGEPGISIDELDVANVVVSLECNGEVAHTGCSSAVLGAVPSRLAG